MCALERVRLVTMSHTGSLPGWKEFVKARLEAAGVEEFSAGAENAAFSGNEARQAYEEIVQKEFISPQKRSRTIKKTSSGECADRVSSVPLSMNLQQQKSLSSLSAETKPPVSLSSLMRYIDSNDSGKVLEAINSDPNLVNAVDQFGWSPLMVASCAGAVEIVELLLLSGANVGLRDKGGQSCLSLAGRKGHLNVIQLIKNFGPQKPESLQSELLGLHEKDCLPETLSCSDLKYELCAACNVEIEQSRKKKHLTSTVHQLSRCTKGCKTFYSIPGNNRGYQLMLKNGWDGEQGLGPSGSGMKLPPKTVLKRDRKGLGASKGPARITHFQSNDTKAVARNSLRGDHLSGSQNKRLLKRQIQSEKMLEIALRRELS